MLETYAVIKICKYECFGSRRKHPAHIFMRAKYDRILLIAIFSMVILPLAGKLCQNLLLL